MSRCPLSLLLVATLLSTPALTAAQNSVDAAAEETSVEESTEETADSDRGASETVRMDDGAKARITACKELKGKERAKCLRAQMTKKGKKVKIMKKTVEKAAKKGVGKAMKKIKKAKGKR